MDCKGEARIRDELTAMRKWVDRISSRWRSLVAALTIALALPTFGIAQAKPSIILATTTSTQDSGLLDTLS